VGHKVYQGGGGIPIGWGKRKWGENLTTIQKGEGGLICRPVGQIAPKKTRILTRSVGKVGNDGEKETIRSLSKNED